MTRALAYVAAVLLGLLLWQTHRVHALQLETASTQQQLAEAQAKAERVAHETSTSIVDALFDASINYQRGLEDAQVASDRDAAALRSGALRLRREWSACETGRLADGSTAERRVAEAIESRNALARAVVRIGDECDAKEQSLILAYNGVRDRINGAKP